MTTNSPKTCLVCAIIVTYHPDLATLKCLLSNLSNQVDMTLIVDNNSPIKDIKLLDKFNLPVHVILCGATEGWILPDYLLLAWKTKGTIHTIEEDITSIAKMTEGQEIKIGASTYKIMGGEFVRITSI